MDKNSLPEAASVAYTNIKTKNGYHWSFTMRCDTVGKLIEQIDAMESVFITKGWIAEEIRNSGFTKKEKEYVEGKLCPKCGSRLIKKTTKDGRPYHTCENYKYDFITKTNKGTCDFVDWLNQNGNNSEA